MSLRTLDPPTLQRRLAALFVVPAAAISAAAAADNWAAVCAALRVNALSCIKSAEHGWVGACFSCCEILAVLHMHPACSGLPPDNITLSKGHAAAMQYSTPPPPPPPLHPPAHNSQTPSPRRPQVLLQGRVQPHLPRAAAVVQRRRLGRAGGARRHPHGHWLAWPGAARGPPLCYCNILRRVVLLCVIVTFCGAFATPSCPPSASASARALLSPTSTRTKGDAKAKCRYE
jgi:hypothetical protein